ncbi:MAG: hypothetical protein FJX46_16240 [Alphaproteobacteria bacterium]|nr:hypothetical protein [Alphaproteobacteria bacterium]
MVPAVRSTIDIVLWFSITAGEEGESLQPLRLQRLLYLAQCHYAAHSKGGKLMPATFLATKYGPLEPTMFHLLEAGPPPVTGRRPASEIEDFLEVLWRKYGHHSADYLDREIRRDGLYALVYENMPNAEIPVSLMYKVYTSNRDIRRVQVPKMSQGGKPMGAWKLKQADPTKVLVQAPRRPVDADTAAKAGPIKTKPR